MRSVPSRCDPGVWSRWSRMRDLGSGFTDEVEGCNLGVIRSRKALGSPAKLKGAIWVRFKVEIELRSRRVQFEVEVERWSRWVRSWRALGSGFDLSLAGAWLAGGVCSFPLSLSLFVCVFRNPFKGKIATEIDFRLERGIFDQSWN